MNWIHKLLGIRVSETDKTRFTKVKEKCSRIKKERAKKEKYFRTGNKSSE